MKVFNRMKEQQPLHGHTVPKGAFYGRLQLKYIDREFTGKTRRIFDKNGYPVFRSDGVQVERRVYRNVPKTADVTYVLEDLFPVSIGNTMCFKAWYKIGDGSWRDETPLNRNGLTIALNNFLVQRVQAYCEKNGKTLFDLCTGVSAIKTDSNKKRHKIALQAAPRRAVQTADTMLMRGHPCYALNPFIINEELQFNPAGSSTKSVIASHKSAFGTKKVYDPLKAENEYKIPEGLGYMADGIRVVYSKKEHARDVAITMGNGHYVAGNAHELERTANMGKNLHTISACEYFG